MSAQSSFVVGQNLSAVVPEEPPRGTVVVTVNGNAFQSQLGFLSRQCMWARAELTENPQGDVYRCSWLELIAMHGPLTVVYLPEN